MHIVPSDEEHNILNLHSGEKSGEELPPEIPGQFQFQFGTQTDELTYKSQSNVSA